MNQGEIRAFIKSCEDVYDAQKELEPLSTAALAILLSSNVVRVIELTAWAMDDPNITPAMVIGQAYVLSILRTREQIATALSEVCKSQAILVAVLSHRIHLDAIAAEIYRRAPSPIARGLLNLSDDSLLKNLQIDSLRDWTSIQENEARRSQHLDLRDDTLLKAIDKIRKRSRKAGPQLSAIRLRPAEVFGISISLSGKRWREWPRMQAVIINQVLGWLDVILWGRTENLQADIRESYREILRRRKRQTTILEGKEDFPKKGAEAWRADWDWENSARKHRHEDIMTQVHPQPEQGVKNSPDVSARMFAVIREARKQK